MKWNESRENFVVESETFQSHNKEKNSARIHIDIATHK